MKSILKDFARNAYTLVSIGTTVFTLFMYYGIMKYITHLPVPANIIVSLIGVLATATVVVILLFGLNRLIFTPKLFIGGIDKFNQQETITRKHTQLIGAIILVSLLVGILFLFLYTNMTIFKANTSPTFTIIFNLSNVNSVVIIIFGLYRILLED